MQLPLFSYKKIGNFEWEYQFLFWRVRIENVLNVATGQKEDYPVYKYCIFINNFNQRIPKLYARL